MNIFHHNDGVREIKNNLKIDIDYFQNPKWQLVTLLEQLSGVWPHQSKVKQYSLQMFHFTALLSILLAVVNKLREFTRADDIEMIIECFITMAFLLGLTIKLAFASKYQPSRQQIYERVSEHFKIMTDTEEAAILKNYADQGFEYTAVYLCIACVTVSIFDSSPILRSYYNYFFVHNELKIQLPIQLDYGFDHKKYWYVVLVDFLMFVFSGILVDFAYDLSFILQVRHVQALFEIVRIRLNKASGLVDECENERIISDDAVNESYSLISSAVDLHSECFEIIKLIEKTYTMNWSVILLINTAVFGAGVHLISLRWHDSVETFRNLCAFSLLLMHFFIIFSQGQQIIDSSSTIFYACYDCKWYCMPKKSCKLLNTMMIRTSNPCMITGAQLFPLSMESFSKMFKAGISYYTVFQT